jgi:glycosyltransferase involved in cell wall biosynthesis
MTTTTPRRSRPARVVYWNNIPSPYTVERLNAVARLNTIELEVWFTSRNHRDRSWTVDETAWDFPYRYLPGASLPRPRDTRQIELRFPVGLLGRRLDLLVSLYAEGVYLAGWTLARSRGIRTAFRVLPTYEAWVRRHPAKEALKRYAFSRVDGVKVPGADGAAYARAYGVPANRIHVVTQSIDVDHFRKARQHWLPQRAAVREELGLEGCVFVYVGRLVDEKGVATLLEAYEKVMRGPNRVSLLLVGDGRDEARYRRLCIERGLERVQFAGFVQQASLPKMYTAADVFVFPTLGDPHGLVVEEALASSLPVISTSAAGDIRSRVPEGEAGFVVPPADANALAVRMAQLAGDHELRDRFTASALPSVVHRTHEQYANDFERFVDSVLRSPRIRTALHPSLGQTFKGRA